MIVTYNGMRWIQRCVRSIAESSIPLQLVIVDNNSTDATVEFVRSNHADAIVLENEVNLGFGRGNNMGMKFALDHGADFVLLLNQDAWLLPDAVLNLIKCQEEDPRLGIVSPIHLNGDGDQLDRSFRDYSHFGSVAEIDQALRTREKVTEVDYVNAAAWLMSRECVVEVGGFDPLFTHYGEDNDYCQRVRYHGWKIGIALNSRIVHDREYNGENPYRNFTNFTLADGIAEVKNVNKRMSLNYLSWLLREFTKTAKWVLKLDFSLAVKEVLAALRILALANDVRISRRVSKFSPSPFL